MQISIDEQIKKIVGKIDRLPTLPTVVATLGDLIRSPHTSAADINKVIMKDQALSSRILKLVNSAFYGFSERISSISHAVVILGFNTVKNVALTASVFDMFSQTTKHGAVFDRKAFWMHSLACAGTAKLIATEARLPAAEDIFIAGLLHDMGKLVLDQHVPEKFSIILDRVQSRNILIRDAEDEVLEDINHSQIGAWLATRWKLPGGLVQVIGLHHRPDIGDQLIKPIMCVHVADILVRSLDFGSGGDKKIPRMNEIGWEALGLTYDNVRHIMNHMEEEFTDTEKFVSEV